jgi:putative sterol carrier protein
MRSCSKLLALTALITSFGTSGRLLASEPILMSDEWVDQACQAWNDEPELTGNLESWIENDGDRGYKLLRVYRRDCPDGPRAEMKIAQEEGKVVCVASGWASDEELTGADYVMFANTDRWLEMGEGSYGPMKGMITGRLKFHGPKWEAMKNMGPFKSFLLLVGKVPGDTGTCPQMNPEDEAPIENAEKNEEPS